MTPIQFEQQYHRIRVPYVQEGGYANSTMVNVNKYRQTSRTATFREKDALLRGINQELRRAGGLRLIDVQPAHRLMVARAFFGKGSPNDYAVALKHAVRYGRSSPNGLQNYCDRIAELGIDCSGFVNNYFTAIGRIHQDQNIAHYARGTRRDNLSEMQGRDVLIWTDPRGNVLPHPRAHIAILNTTPNSQGRAVVVESASSLHGLSHSTYVFSRVRHNVFEVIRPSGRSHVRVVAV